MNEILTPNTYWLLVLLAGVPICVLCLFWGFMAGSLRGFQEGYEKGAEDERLKHRLEMWCSENYD
jgi:hypothetical protein